MDEPKKKPNLLSVIVALVAGVVAFVMVSQGTKLLRQRDERRKLEKMTAAWGLDPATRDRIQGVLEREMKVMTSSPRARQLMDERLAAAKRSGEKVDPMVEGKVMGRDLVARGMRRLPDEEMETMQQLRMKAAESSERTCACFWDPAGCTEADVMDGLARLSQPDLVTWARLSAAAALAELENKTAPASSEDDLAEGLTAIGATLSDAQRARFEAIINPPDPKQPPSKAEQCFAVRTMFAGGAKLPSPARLKFTRALFALGAAP
jgi:hypothetical protein